MTEAQKLQNEIDALNAKMKAAKEENTVKGGFPEMKKTYSYRKQTIVRANDISRLYEAH